MGWVTIAGGRPCFALVNLGVRGQETQAGRGQTDQDNKFPTIVAFAFPSPMAEYSNHPDSNVAPILVQSSINIRHLPNIYLIAWYSINEYSITATIEGLE